MMRERPLSGFITMVKFLCTFKIRRHGRENRWGATTHVRRCICLCIYIDFSGMIQSLLLSSSSHHLRLLQTASRVV